MTEDQRQMAFALSKVSFPLGSSAKRFAVDMAVIAANPGATKKISAKQHQYLVGCCIRFRRQLPAHIVELANRLQLEEQRDA